MFPGLWLAFVMILQRETEATKSVTCQISKKSITYEYKCPIRLNQSIDILVNFEVITVSCHDVVTLNESFLPEINLGSGIPNLRLENCPAISNGFEKLLKKFHIEKLSVLEVRTEFDESIQLQHFVGMESLKSLVLRKNITHFDRNIFKLIPYLTYLDLRENNLLLYDELFKYSPHLITLDLARNNITYLPNKVLRGLFRLKFLYLHGNKIEKIEKNVFRDLVVLEELRLNNNLLIQLDESAFQHLEKLTILDMNNNKLENITEKIFENCNYLQSVHLNNNKKLYFEYGVFSELSYLNYLTLKNSGIKTLPGNLFMESRNLVLIDLQHNDLKSLPRDIFKNLEILEILYLNNNKLEILDRDIFTSLVNLKYLVLRDNLLSNIIPDLLKGLENLEKLDLSFNQIHTIDNSLFARKYNLIIFLINNNQLDLINFSPSVMKDCRNIKLLNMANNSVSQFPYGMLESLVQRYNHHMDLSLQHPAKQPRKVELFLQNNNIAKVRFSHFSSYNSTSSVLVLVDISDNPIYCDCFALDLVPRSKSKNKSKHEYQNHIRIHYGNLFCSGPPALVDLPIKEVDENQLICSLEKNCTRKNECDCHYKSATAAIVIDCSNRNLSDVPQLVLEELSKYFDFVTFNRIKVHLEDNFLEEGPTEIDGYQSIRELCLQRNKLKSIEWLPSFLEVLNLEDNQLESINSEIVNSLNESIIREISLSNNPWRCDCTTKDFITYLWTHISMINNATYIRCQELGKPLITLEEDEFCPIRAELTSVLSSAILIFFIIISAIIFIYYIYREEILIWLYAKGICLWLIKEERLDKNKKYDAFVSFAHQDEEFVMDRLLPVLELGSPPYKLCVHIRDWIPGQYITTQISNSVRDSKRTLIILSPSFIKSVWGRMEFRTAHTSAMKEGRVRIILVIYGDIEMDQLDEELKAYIRTNTYIEWGDPWFWKKLRYALPRTRQRQKKPKVGKRMASVENDIELQ